MTIGESQSPRHWPLLLQGVPFGSAVGGRTGGGRGERDAVPPKFEECRIVRVESRKRKPRFSLWRAELAAERGRLACEAGPRKRIREQEIPPRPISLAYISLQYCTCGCGPKSS